MGGPPLRGPCTLSDLFLSGLFAFCPISPPTWLCFSQHVPLFRGELPGGQRLGGPRHHRFLFLGLQSDPAMGHPPPARQHPNPAEGELGAHGPLGPRSATPMSRGIPAGALKWAFEKDFLFSRAPCPPALAGRGLHGASCAPSPHGSPGVSVRTVRTQSLARGPPARGWLSWASWKALCLSGVPCCGIRVRGAHSFDPAVGPSGSVPGLLVGEGTAAGSTAQEAGAGQATSPETGPQTGSHRLWYPGRAGGEPCPTPLRAPLGCGACVCGPLRVCALGDRLAVACRSCWLKGSRASAPRARAGGCGGRPCWGSCGCCAWAPRWAAPWPSTPSQSS